MEHDVRVVLFGRSESMEENDRRPFARAMDHGNIDSYPLDSKTQRFLC